MSKGVIVGDNFSPAQIEAIELFAAGGLNCGEIAVQVGVSPNTITAWRRNHQFMSAIVTRARELIRISLPDIYRTAITKAQGGDHKHIKILLDHLDNIDRTKVERNTAQITFTWEISDNQDTVPSTPVPDAPTPGPESV